MQLYQESPIAIPAAEIYVAYNGEKPLEENRIKLRQHYTKENQGCVDVEVKVIDINYERLPAQIATTNDTLTGYSYLMSRINFYRKRGKSINEAVEQAKQDTLEKGLLTECLNRKEFITMATQMITIEEQIALTEQASFLKGKAEEKIEIARNLLDVLDVPLIAKKTGLTIEEVEQLKN